MTLNNIAPDENQGAYKGFTRPKQEEYKIQDLSEINVAAIAANLDSMEQKQQNNLIIKLLFSLIKAVIQVLQTNQLLVQRLVHSQNYLLTHESKMLIKLGYSESIENRLRTHRRNGWIVLATGEGSKEREKAMLQTLRENGFRPEPSSEEIFTITPKLVDILCANNWVGANENREFILDKFPQQKIFSD